MAYSFSISALKTIDCCESAQNAIFDWVWHNIVAKVNLNMTFSKEDKAKKKQTSSAWNVFPMWSGFNEIENTEIFWDYIILSNSLLVFFPRLNKTNADRTLSHALMGSLINLDRYQCLCTFWLCFGYDFCVVWSVVRRDVLI